MKLFLPIFAIFLFWPSKCESAKILGIFHFPSKSHHILGSALLKALAKKGHEVTMISPYPLEKNMPNYKDVFLEGAEEFKKIHIDPFLNPTASNMSWFQNLRSLLSATHKYNTFFWEHSEVQKMLKSNEQYDVAIICYVMNEAFLGLAHKLGASTVMFSTVGTNAFVNTLTMNPSPYSYVPATVVEWLSDEMNFLQRTANTLFHVANELLFSPLSSAFNQEFLSKYVPDAPSLYQLRKNISLVLLNSHYSVESVRPHLPNMIQVGGLQISEAKKLPKDLETLLNGAKDGAVLFSFGSNVRIGSLSVTDRENIVRSLKKLKPMKVLVKSEVDLPDKPDNVVVSKWLPQNDVLAHPNVKAFVSHGGLLSTMEAVYHAVPVVGIPFFGDQQSNVAEIVKAGYGVKVDIKELTEEKLYSALKEILHNPSYSENIKKRSALLKDQPLKPIDNAVFWVEHIIRHGGGQHLKHAGTKLYWYQYMLLDVIAFLLVSISIITFIICRLIRTIFRCIRGKCCRNKVKFE